MSKKLKQKILIISMIIVFILIYKVFLQGITAQSIRDWVSGFGVMAPIAYIFVWAILPIFFFPVPVLALAGGLSFGLVDGTIYTLIGAMVNSNVSFSKYTSKRYGEQVS